jgi:hypothetical protein
VTINGALTGLTIVKSGVGGGWQYEYVNTPSPISFNAGDRIGLQRRFSGSAYSGFNYPMANILVGLQ